MYALLNPIHLSTADLFSKLRDISGTTIDGTFPNSNAYSALRELYIDGSSMWGELPASIVFIPDTASYLCGTLLSIF